MAQPDERIKKIRRNNWIVLAVETIPPCGAVNVILLAKYGPFEAQYTVFPFAARTRPLATPEVEGNKLIVNDFDTISELTTFVADKTSFKADDGHNDDLVMGLVMFAWATGQKYFKDLRHNRIRSNL